MMHLLGTSQWHGYTCVGQLAGRESWLEHGEIRVLKVQVSRLAGHWQHVSSEGGPKFDCLRTME